MTIRVLRQGLLAIGLMLLLPMSAACTSRPQHLSAPRTFAIGTRTAPASWFRVSGTTAQVRGCFDFYTEEQDAGPVDFIVPQDFGGVRVFHVLPLVIDSDTLIQDAIGEHVPLKSLQSDFNYADAVVSVRGGRFHADALRMSTETQSWDGANNYLEYPPGAEWNIDAPVSPRGDTWLDVGNDGSVTVRGYTFSSGSGDDETTGKTVSRYWDVLIPDRIAGAWYEHAIRLYTTNPAAPGPNPALTEPDASGQWTPGYAVTKAHVIDGRFVPDVKQ